MLLSGECKGPGPAGTRRSWWAWVGLALTLCLAAALRLAAVHESLWLDELHTAWTVADGFQSIVPRAAIGNQSPLYFLLVWAWTTFAGLNELAVRTPSLLAGLLLVAGVCEVVRRWTGSDAAGLCAALLAAVDGNCVFYAQEARTYALVQLVALGQAAAFRQVLETPTVRWRLAFAAGSIAMYYLHYTALLLLAAEVTVYVGLWLWRPWRPQYRPGQLVRDWAVLGLCLLPSAPQLWDIARRREAWAKFIDKQPFQHVFTMLPVTVDVLLPLGLCAAAWCVQAACRARRPWRGPPPRTIAIASGWLVVPLALAWGLTEWDWARLFFVRYLSVTLVVPSILAGLAVAACPDKWSRGVCAATIAVAALWPVSTDSPPSGSRHAQDWRSAVRTLRERVGNPRTPVFVRSGLIEADRLDSGADARLREYCLLPVLGIYRTAQERDSLVPLPTTHTTDLSPADRSRMAAAGEAWFLLLGAPADVAVMSHALLSGWEGTGVQPRLTEQRACGAVAVLRLELAPPSAAGK